MKATVHEVRNEPVEREELDRALGSLLDLLGIEDPRDAVEVHVTRGTLRVRFRPRDRRGRRVANALVTVRHRIVGD